jgi:hypothetical protein
MYTVGADGGFGITTNPKDINAMKEAFTAQVTTGFNVFNNPAGIAQVFVVNSIANPFAGSAVEAQDVHARSYYENAFAVHYL